MTEFTVSDFMKLTIGEVSDLLIEKLSDEKHASYALLEGERYKLCVKLELVDNE